MKAIELKDCSGNTVFVVSTHVTHVTQFPDWTEIAMDSGDFITVPEAAVAVLKKLRLR